MPLTARRLRALFVSILLALSLAALPGCGGTPEPGSTSTTPSTGSSVQTLTTSPAGFADGDQSASASSANATFDLAQIPSYTGSPYTVVNDNVPTFTEADLAGPEESYSPLDSLGRCGAAQAIVRPATMPTEERTSIGMIRPSGWHTVRYDDLIADRYLFNRCHLIGFQLAGENANERNLITGTRYLNVEGMLPFENEMADYVRATGNRVLLRATPVFVGDELVARGVHLEAQSVEDNGTGVSFNVFCYNVQPGIDIDYATGESWRAAQPVAEASDESGNTAEDAAPSVDANAPASPEPAGSGSTQMTYILNTNTDVFHLPGCGSVNRMSEHNKQEFTGARKEVTAAGFRPCGNCNP
ncbi:DNA/RNA non-specific endonuclease [Collinsella intestinalis]|uniref:DNA/RNA non-specific endonuclease n=2 Tax=Collinsella TaxID=102106 RepID=UPI00195929E5|nr:DNA/RNA non-specific endonuclease [Collinsella intestinalis]MBM6682331.1 DNA/RNA non-specific endonuclease [Collinsella intestinalis]